MSFDHPPQAIHATIPAAQKTATESVTLNLMTFNIWRGGEEVNFEMIKEAILKANADIVAIQESEGNLVKLAELLGWPYINTRTQILSKYPLFDPENSSSGIAVKEEGGFTHPYIYVEVFPGKIIAVSNVHLNSEMDGAEAVRDGAQAKEILANENKLRVSQLQPIFQTLSALEKQGIPVFLMGDFNAPSHQDWTAQVAKIRKQVKFPLEWPESKALVDAGFTDSYRDIHVDPVTNPGFTWTAGCPNPRISPNETINRIDYIWRKGKSKTLDSFTVGEAGTHMCNGEHINKDVKHSVTPWPSDHRAVVSSFTVEPAEAPAMVTLNQRLFRSGDTLRLKFILPRNDLKLAILPVNGTIPKDVVLSRQLGNGFDRTTFSFSTQELVPGQYQAVLLTPNNQELSKTSFWVIAKEDRPILTTSKKVFQENEPIAIEWKNAPGNKWDWIALYKADSNDLEDFLTNFYINAGVEGKITLNDRLPKGDYKLRLLINESSIELVSTTFSIQ